MNTALPTDCFELSLADASVTSARDVLLRLLPKIAVRRRRPFYLMLDELEGAARRIVRARELTSGSLGAAEYLRGEDDLCDLSDADQQRTAEFEFNLLRCALESSVAALALTPRSPLAGVRVALYEAASTLSALARQIPSLEGHIAAPASA